MAQAPAEIMRAERLFGGAATMSVPERMTDVSDFRPVPDHQEVFADDATDQSVLVDILEHKADVADANAARFFFEDLAQANEATSISYEGELPLGVAVGGSSFVTVASGMQRVSKGRQGSEANNEIQVLAAVVRFPSHAADLVISLNTPVFISEHSAAAEHAGAGLKNTHLAALPLFESMLRSFKVIEFKLFGSGPS